MSSRNYRNTERGEGRFRFLLTLAVVALIIYAAMQFIPAYAYNLQMEDATREIITQAALQNLREGDVRARLVEKAIQYQLPDDAKIELVRDGKRVSARITYTKIIKLPYYTYYWPFEIRVQESGF